MSITVKPVTPDFVAEISGIDLARPLASANRDAIEDAINRYAVVVFRGQTLNDDQQIAFARHFGPIHSSAQRARHTAIKHRLAAKELASLPPVPQRFVRRHPGSGRKTLYLASHASHIIGMPIADGRLLLMDLIEHATRRQFVHSHSWKQGDLVIWDNRCT